MLAGSGAYRPADKHHTNILVPEDQITDAMKDAQMKLRVAARKYTKENPLGADSPERVRIRKACELKIGSPVDKANVPVKQTQNGPADSPTSIFARDLDAAVDESELSDTE
jgi:hypothetical protein